MDKQSLYNIHQETSGIKKNLTLSGLRAFFKTLKFHVSFSKHACKSKYYSSIISQESVSHVLNFLFSHREILSFISCQAEFEAATAEKIRCQTEAETTAKTIELANRLVGGLASENVRWAESIAQFRENEKTLPGDVLMITAFVSYVGSFTKVTMSLKAKYINTLINRTYLDCEKV